MNASLLSTVEMAPRDPILGITEAFKRLVISEEQRTRVRGILEAAGMKL